MTSWPLHTLVFDLDDTLIAERDYVSSGFRAADAWIAAKHGVSGFGRAAQILFDAGKRGRIFDEALVACGASDGRCPVTELIDVYREHAPQITLLPDALEFIEWAKERFTLAVITDGFAVAQRQKIEAVGLSRWISTIFVTDEWGREFWKPSPRAFEEVMRLHPGASGGYVYIADNPRKDFIAPRALGWRTVRIRRPGGEHSAYEAAPAESAEREISDLGELMML